MGVLLQQSGGQPKISWPFSIITHCSVSYKKVIGWKKKSKLSSNASDGHRASIVWSRHACSSFYNAWRENWLKSQILRQLEQELRETEEHIGSFRKEVEGTRDYVADCRQRWDDLRDMDFQDDRILELLQRKRTLLIKAMEAAENGGFGICEVCGCHIDAERLRALPSTMTCIMHAEG